MQASKPIMRKPTRLINGKAVTGREASDTRTDSFRRGSGGGTQGRGGVDATREALPVAWHAPTDDP